jgi:hypothetical protein
MAQALRTFDTAINDVYKLTRDEFARRRTDLIFAKYVVPLSTAPKPGFAIFYNPPTFQPPLLIIGLNPANFAPGDSLKTFPNKEMLCGKPPTANSYLDHTHLFAKALQVGFAGQKALFKATRGMNLWFFQSSSDAAKAPRELREFCSERTKDLVKIVKPEMILCLSSHAFASLTKGVANYPVSGATKARFADVNGTRIWYSYHPTASRIAIRAVGVADLPIVVANIAAARKNRVKKVLASGS